MPRPEFPRRIAHGFTMVEAVVVISILGVVGAMMAVFIKMPVQGYMDAARRAELTDIADTALRRLSRDLRLALPNSIRVTESDGVLYLEFLQVGTGGIYRGQCSSVGCSGGTEDILDFTQADSAFDVLGGFSSVAPAPAIGNHVAVFNLGVPGADAYAGDTIATITSVSANRIGIQAKQFPFESPLQRFHVVQTPVTYVCAPGSSGGFGTGTLTRYWGYAISAGQPTNFSGASSALLAAKVSACAITAPENTLLPGYALVPMSLTLLSAGEAVSLYQEVHVENVP